MPRMVNQAVESNFINGLVTEATALNFPENAATDTDNCVFHPKGDVYRRYGLEFEPSYESVTEASDDITVASYYWQNAAGLADKNFLVNQVNGILRFYATNSVALSGDLNASTIDISTYSSDVDLTKCRGQTCRFAQGQGYLIVVNPYTDPFYVKYDPDLDTFSATVINVTVRDTQGVDEGTGFIWDTRPLTLTDKHKYNLWNQGWTEEVQAYYATPKPALDQWIAFSGAYRPVNNLPSNADVWWLFKDASEAFNWTKIDLIKRGNTPAPKGHYTYSAWNLDRNSILAGIENETSGSERPRTVAFYAGRAWYAGVQAQGYGSRIYFTQIIKNPAYLASCHQLNDPTNQYLYSILATDGGVIDILDCGTVVHLYPFQSMLLIFATNGLWAITGSQGVGFSPTDFTIKKLSSIPAISDRSFVDVDGNPLWWNNDGIYTLSISSPQLGAVQLSSLTEKTIRSFFTDIPTENKQWAQGSYNPVTKQVQWLFRYRPMVTNADRFKYDRALTFNVTTKAFYPWTFPHQDVKICNVTCIPTYSTNLVDVPTRDINGDLVYDVNNELEITREQTTSLSAAVFKYLTIYPSGGSFAMTFSESYDTSYKDFKTYDTVGNEINAYLFTGYLLLGKANLKGQETYVTVFCNNVDPSYVTFQGVWDYATSVTSARYTLPQTILFEGPARKYYFRKMKIRGNGRSLQLRFTSLPGRPFNLSGWARQEALNKAA